MGVLIELEAKACESRVAGHQLGWICVIEDELAMPRPVTYVWNDGVVVFCVTKASKLVDAAGTRATFAVGLFDEDARCGWSVVGKGRLRDVTQSVDLQSVDLRKLQVTPWAEGEKPVWLAFAPESWHGREIC